LIPPCPIANASVAAQIRRERSSNAPLSKLNFFESASVITDGIMEDMIPIGKDVVNDKTMI